MLIPNKSDIDCSIATFARMKLNEAEAKGEASLSQEELFWLESSGLISREMRIARNPNSTCEADLFVIGRVNSPSILQYRNEEVTSASVACCAPTENGQWAQARRHAGYAHTYFLQKGSGQVSCAGGYLNYGPGHLRLDSRQDIEPGNIHCVVFANLIPFEQKLQRVFRYVETVAQARTWVEKESARVRNA